MPLVILDPSKLTDLELVNLYDDGFAVVDELRRRDFCSCEQCLSIIRSHAALIP